MKNSDLNNFDICGIGMTVIDHLQVVNDFPADAGVTKVREDRLIGGGPVPTALCTAGHLGAKVAVIDRIGDDWKGRLMKDEYLKYRVNTDHLTLEPGKTTTFSNILVRESDGERHILFSEGDFTPLGIADLPKPALEATHLLHLNGRHWPACLEAAAIVRKSGGQVSFDGGANRFDPKFRELLELTDIAIVARDFAEKLSNSTEIADQLAALVGFGASIAGVTNGAEGSWFATGEGEVFHQPAFPVPKVVDTTGCGDVFHGGFLFALSRGWAVREAATFASALAAHNAGSLGGRGKLATLAEVVAMIEKH